jgi:probable HAF family extracellular repeat protein
MKCLDRLFALLSVSILLSSVALAQATLKFHLTDLGTMNGSESTANAINNSGQVVGYHLTSNGDQWCFLYRGGAWQDVAMGRGSPNICTATAINDTGQIAGTH